MKNNYNAKLMQTFSYLFINSLKFTVIVFHKHFRNFNVTYLITKSFWILILRGPLECSKLITISGLIDTIYLHVCEKSGFHL